MHLIASSVGTVLLLAVLLDAFQTIILPRRPVGRVRLTRIFFILTWHPWKRVATRIASRRTREQIYSIFGPLSLLSLFFFWALLLTIGFALVFFGLRVPFHDGLLTSSAVWPRLRSALYVSGTTLFTLGLGDVLPQSQIARLLTVIEAGTGLGFVALVIGYVPVLYSSFSHREILVALLDARAGSPPAAAELLQRHSFEGGEHELRTLLASWEVWCAEMLETHVSYPILCFYRSQHDNQSWIAALTAILDACALLIAMSDGRDTRQAQLTFAIGRHTLVDLVHVFHQEQVERRFHEAPLTRLPDEDLDGICGAMQAAGRSLCQLAEGRERLQALRLLYEPSACAMAEYLQYGLPSWTAPETAGKRPDAWRAVAALRAPSATFTRHVSARATAANLDDHDGEPS